MTTITRSLPDLSRSLIAPDYMEARKFGIGPDLAIRTGAMFPVEAKDLPSGDAGKSILRMRGSSTIQDLQEDTMMYSALQSMCKVPAGMTLFLNHSYDLPDDAFGKLYDMPEVQIMQNGIADLWLSEETFLRNPPAKRTHDMIVIDTARFGSSVGCQVLNWSLKDPDDLFSPVLIHEVLVVEWSVVGVPANQRCWVENAIKGLFANSLTNGNGDVALKLTPAFKGLYPRDFASAIEYVTSDGLRNDMQRLRARGSTPQRIMFSFENDSFYLEERGMKKSLTREETADLLTKTAPKPAPPTPQTWDVEEDDLDSTKTVCGKTSWPLMAIGTEWTGSKAESAIFAYAKGDDGDIVPSKAKQGFLYCDASKDPKLKGAYKMPFCYGGDGGLKIVPLGVRAAANVLNGGMGGVHASDEDKAGMRGKCKTMYGRINSEFSPDPKWVVPWESKEDSATDFYTSEMTFMQTLGFEVIEQGDTFSVKNADGELIPWLSKSDGALDSTTGEELIRQDLGEQPSSGDTNKTAVPRANDVAVGNDGTHPLCTGTHKHIHPAYDGPDEDGDGKHSHSHDHDGDAQHSHSHAEKHTHPHTQKARVAIDDDGNHEPFTGSHTHQHKSYGQKADGSMHSHDHDHDGDTNHRHSHTEKSLTRAAIDTDDDGNHKPYTGTHTHAHKAFGGPDGDGDGMHSHEHDHDGDTVHKHPHKDDKKSLDQIRLDKLSLFNTLGMELGFPEHTFTTKCSLVTNEGDAGIVRSTLSALDDCSDAMIAMAARADGYVDALMGLMGVPDMNGDGDDGDGADDIPTTSPAPNPFPGRYHFHPMHVKEGREISGKNAAIHQQIHNLLHSLHPDGALCKNGPAADQLSGDGTSHQDGSLTVSEAQEEARQMGQGDSYSNLASFVGDMLKASLAKALEGVSAKQVVYDAVEHAIEDQRANLDLLKREQVTLMQSLSKLANMPLGRPTNFQRTITPVSNRAIDNIATYDEMLAVAGLTLPKQTLQEALAQTTIVEKEISSYGQQAVKSRFRHWPATVGGTVGEGVRPPLTTTQKTLMHWNEWDTYNAGGAVDVPVVDDPAERV